MGEYVEWPMEGQPGGAIWRGPQAPGPALIVIQEWWGLVPHIEEVCDRYAAEGYLALAPDMYHGRWRASRTRHASWP
jgi:carboxymethylenebutenolidase